MLIDSLKKAFNSYSKIPFPFAWGSLLFIFLFIVFFFAVIGLALIYFLSMSVLNQEVNPQSVATMAVFAMMGLIFILLINGLNAALAKAYRSAMWKEKMSLTGFFAYTLEKAPVTFAVMLMRELVWLLIAGPGIAIYVFFLKGIDFMDILTALYVLFVTFFIHMLFTPPLVYTGLGMDLFGAFKRTIHFFRHRHINFIGLYFVFAVAWLLNFIPFIGLVSIFFLYPVAYTAMIAMMEGGVKIDREDEES